MKNPWVISILLAVAHHSVNASHDSTKPVTLTGTIDKVQWVNPHSWLTLQVRSENGQVATQRVEMAGPSRLAKVGVDRSLFQVGQTVSVEAWPPKPEFKNDAFSGRWVILADGRRLDIHDAFGEP